MKKIHILLLIITFIIGCTPKRLIYLQKDPLELPEQEYILNDTTYHMQPNDIMSISLNSVNEEAEELFNVSQSTVGANQSSLSTTQGGGGNLFFFNGFIVSDSGYIDLPIAGKIKVGGLTPKEAEQIIKTTILEFVTDAYVSIRFVNFKVTFFGEFNNPGVNYFYQNKLNIFEAITQAGGMTAYGNRRKLLIIRPTEKGNRTISVDLTQRRILESEDLFLYPNDMVYAEPITAKIFQTRSNDVLYVLSSVTTLLTGVALILAVSK